MSTKTHCTVRIPRDLRDQVDAVAALQNRSTSDVIRLAIEQFVTGAKRADDSHLRHMRVTEYAQIALDAIIRQDYPDLRDHLIAQTDLRMEQYHGAR